MIDNFEVNGKAVPKVHRPPSLVFRDWGNEALGVASLPGTYRCVDYRTPIKGDLFYSKGDDAVLECLFDLPNLHVIVERIPERVIDADQAP